MIACLANKKPPVRLGQADYSMAWILQAKSSLTGVDRGQDSTFAQQGGTHHVAFNKDVPKVQGQDFAKGQGRAASSLPRV